MHVSRIYTQTKQTHVNRDLNIKALNGCRLAKHLEPHMTHLKTAHLYCHTDAVPQVLV